MSTEFILSGIFIVCAVVWYLVLLTIYTVRGPNGQ